VPVSKLLISFLQVQRHGIVNARRDQSEPQCVGATTYSDAITGAAVTGVRFLEVLHDGTANESSRDKCMLQYRRQLVLELNMRGYQI
jgi:hypothetical protein